MVYKFITCINMFAIEIPPILGTLRILFHPGLVKKGHAMRPTGQFSDSLRISSNEMDPESHFGRFSEKKKTGWWFEPRWKILVNWDDYSNIWENKKWQPNHQPDVNWCHLLTLAPSTLRSSSNFMFFVPQCPVGQTWGTESTVHQNHPFDS